jgi:hypothetical protein
VAEPVTQGFERAGRLMHALKIFDARDLPYRTQLVPLASALAVLGDGADHDGIRTKLARWFWCGVFGELYGGAIESRFARDVPELLAWVKGGAEPTTMADANFNASRLLTLKTRNSAAYKGLSAVLMKEGALDFRSGDPVDLQCISTTKSTSTTFFPRNGAAQTTSTGRAVTAWWTKTPLSAKTNRQIGGNSPSQYLGKIQKASGITPERMDQILQSHLVEPKATRKDGFDAFFAACTSAILDRIEAVMGKPVMGRDSVTPTPAQRIRPGIQ